ncbi:MAG: baseplate J/gp47 family protein [Fusobacteriaceae bacterium]
MYNARKQTDIRNSILNEMKNALAKNEGSYNFDIAGATSLGINSLEEYIEWLQLQLFPWSVTDDHYLEQHMIVWNLKRRTPTFAAGEVIFYGKANANIPNGTIVISRLGISYKTLNSVILKPDGTAIVKIECLVSGEEGNCPVGDITTLQISSIDIDRVTNLNPIVGGYAIETIESCKNRMREKASIPAHSGNKNDYLMWCKEVSGVGDVRVVGAGEYDVLPGSVKVYISNYNYSPASAELISAVQIKLENERPINDNVLVLSMIPLELNIKIETVSIAKGRYTKEEYIKEIEDTINSAIKNGLYVLNGIVSIPRTGSLILSIDGTVDYDSLTINGGSSNIQVAYNAVTVLKKIVITNYNEV